MNMNFDEALEAIQHGNLVKRKDWSDDLTLDLEDVAAEDWVIVIDGDDDDDEDFE